ncbi:MAG: GNAT family N-acetyltransferase, partial [Pseudomonadota bacterium]
WLRADLRGSSYATVGVPSQSERWHCDAIITSLVVIMVSLKQGLGIGRQLLDAALQLAKEKGCQRAWLITTNNNSNAIKFYAANGWQQVAIHHHAVKEARRLKPELPEFDGNGVPIRDEIEFEVNLSD